MNREANLLHVNILSEVYIDPEINNRELADTEDETASLANSIESTAGLLQPIVIYATPDSRKKEHGMPYELGSGYRRCAALKHLAVSLQDDSWVEVVPAMLHEKTEIAERHIHQLIENLQRKDLKPMEIALAFQKAINDKASNLSQSDLARKIGWAIPTVSNYMKVANNLLPEVQAMVMANEIPWSSAKELASVVSKHKISDAEQNELAAIAKGSSTEDFAKHLMKSFQDSPAATDEDESKGEVSTGNEGSQRTYNAIRGSLLEKKYLPKLDELAKAAKTPEEKIKFEAYSDAIKFVLQVDGTSLGATLAPWEEKLDQEAEARKLADDRARFETQYVRKAVSAIKKKLKEVPPATLPDGSANPHREAPTLPQVLKSIKDEVIKSKGEAKTAGLEEHSMVEGFLVANVDDFITKISAAYVDSVKKDKEAADRRQEAKEKKEAEEAKANAEKGEAVAETATA